MPTISDGLNRIFRNAFLARVALILLVSAAIATAGAQTERDSAVKAGIILNFAKFVDWPDSALTGPGAFTFCVGENLDFSRIFKQAAKGKKIGSLPVEVADVKYGDPLHSCHVLYIPHTEQDRVKGFLKEAAYMPVLSVGDAEDFAGNGGIIGFYMDGGRIRFEICRARASQNGLSISSELLRLAKLRANCYSPGMGTPPL